MKKKQNKTKLCWSVLESLKTMKKGDNNYNRHNYFYLGVMGLQLFGHLIHEH